MAGFEIARNGINAFYRTNNALYSLAFFVTYSETTLFILPANY